MEIWKDIEGYNGKYQVSNLGRVKSLNYLRTGNERILKPGKDKYGYLQLILCNEGKQKRFFVHRLVASAFIENPNNLSFINHKDENPLNNNVDNLEWCTPKYNSNFGTRNERMGANQKNRKLIKCIETGIVYNSIHHAGRETGVSYYNISRCCNGKYKTAGKFHWEFV